ncbi:MAG: hypothetical protein OXC57_11815 [Rhodobacteraceae bacterium]|nr:hypothetical protein [Paracoccaceae bacterium]
MQAPDMRRGGNRHRSDDPVLRHLPVPQKSANPDLAGPVAARTACRNAAGTMTRPGGHG